MPVGGLQNIIEEVFVIDEVCQVEVGSHSDIYWIDEISDLIVCTRHMNQYNERADELGPFKWERLEPERATGTYHE